MRKKEKRIVEKCDIQQVAQRKGVYREVRKYVNWKY